MVLLRRLRRKVCRCDLVRKKILAVCGGVKGEEYSKTDEGREHWEKGQMGPSSKIFRSAGGETSITISTLTPQSA